MMETAVSRPYYDRNYNVFNNFVSNQYFFCLVLEFHYLDVHLDVQFFEKFSDIQRFHEELGTRQIHRLWEWYFQAG